MADSTHRLDRVASLLKEELAALILRKEIKDPRVDSMVVISDVTVSRDLEHAKVRISGYLSHNRLDKAVAGLNHASGFIQARLGKRLKFRVTPRLVFLVDHSIEEGFAVTQTMKDIMP